MLLSKRATVLSFSQGTMTHELRRYQYLSVAFLDLIPRATNWCEEVPEASVIVRKTCRLPASCLHQEVDSGLCFGFRPCAIWTKRQLVSRGLAAFRPRLWWYLNLCFCRDQPLSYARMRYWYSRIEEFISQEVPFPDQDAWRCLCARTRVAKPSNQAARV